MVKKLDLLSVDEARQVRDKIHALREYWIPRAGKALPFFTLGTASYLDYHLAYIEDQDLPGYLVFTCVLAPS